MPNLSRLRLAALVLVAAIVPVACGSDPESGSRDPETVELGEADSGGTVALRVGDELVVRLDSNVTTGFAWISAADPAVEVLELVGSAYEEPESPLLGAGGQEVWTFVATGEGTTDVELAYQRASGEASGRTFAMSVEVAADS